jgi:hypothetical protein
VRDEILLDHLEGLASQLGIKTRYEKVHFGESVDQGGLCRVRGEYLLIINSQATPKEKIRITLKALKQFDLSEAQVLPVIRKLLEKSP